MDELGQKPTSFQEYYWANKPKIQATKRRYSEANKTKLNSDTRQWHKDNPEKSLLTSARSRAKRQGVPFDLELEDIVFPENCPVLGIPLVVKEGARTDNTPSLDKIVPEKGYVKGNVRIISWRANRLKCDALFWEIECLYHYMREALNELRRTNMSGI